jgi:hypothetical protein
MSNFEGKIGREDNLLYYTTERQKNIDAENGQTGNEKSKNHKKSFMDYDFMKDFVHFKRDVCFK